MKALLKALAGSRSWIPTGARLILVSHDISAAGDPTYSAANSTPPSLFQRQLEFLKARFRFVPLAHLLADPDPKPLAALTFDDGFLTVATRAAPMLRKLSVPFTVFCNAQAIRDARLDYGEEYEPLPTERCRFYMNEMEVRELVAGGASIGSHGFSHRPLAALDSDRLRFEVSGNKEFLEALTGAPVPDFAFPFGKRRHISEAALAACRHAGHSRIYSAQAGYAQAGAELIPRASLHLQDEQALHLLLNRLALSRLIGRA